MKVANLGKNMALRFNLNFCCSYIIFVNMSDNDAHILKFTINKYKRVQKVNCNILLLVLNVTDCGFTLLFQLLVITSKVYTFLCFLQNKLLIPRYSFINKDNKAT